MRLAARTATTSGVVTSSARVGHLDGGRARAGHLGAAVDDDDLVAGAQGADDLAGRPVGDLLAAFALAGREQQGEAGVVA